MSASVVRKDSLKILANLGVTSDNRVPALNIQDLTKNPAWVASSVHQLKEIDFHLQNKEIDQHKKISDNINNVISCLQTLDNCRLQLHEELEKEAITTFSLFHTIKTLPLSIKVEINAAVEAAHSQNEMDIASKAAVLSELEDKICTLRDEQLRLEKDNNSLLPQRNLIRKQHDGLVINLNKLLEEKSRIQIDVNETREKIRQHNQEIVETEMSIQELKAKLDDEHDQANRKIQNYKCDIEKIKKKKEQWDKKNLHVSQQLSEVNVELTESKLALQELQNNEKIQEKVLLDLKKQNQHLILQIQAERTAQEHLTNTKKKLTETLGKITKKNACILSEKQKILDDIKLRVDYETKQSKELQQHEEDLQKVIVECTDAEKKAKEEVEESETKLHSKQLELSEHTEKLASFDSENTRNKDAIRKMIENHGLLIAQFNREIEKRKSALKEEKQLRSEAQHDRDSLTQKMRMTEEQKVKYASKMKQKISELKEQFTKNSIAGKELQKDVQEKNEALQKLDEERKSMEETMKKMAEEKEQLIKQTKDRIAVLEETIKERTKILEDRMPSFEEVEKKYQQQCKIYQERKDAFSTQRRNEINLKKNLHQTQKNLDEMKMMQEKEQQQIKNTQNEYLSILNSNSEESKLLEEDIYVQSCKLKSIIEENHTLKNGIDGLEKGIVDTDQCIEEGKKLHQSIIEELVETRRKLTNSFKETTLKEETLNCRDTEMMHQLSGVLNILNHNSNQVNSVAEQLFKQLEGFGIYLDQVCNKRSQ